MNGLRLLARLQALSPACAIQYLHDEIDIYTMKFTLSKQYFYNEIN
jgi:hypothetical protein